MSIGTTLLLVFITHVTHHISSVHYLLWRKKIISFFQLLQFSEAAWKQTLPKFGVVSPWTTPEIALHKVISSCLSMPRIIVNCTGHVYNIPTIRDLYS